MSALNSGQAAAKFTPQQLRAYREQFQIFDLNGDGVISVMELAKVSNKLGYRLTPDKLKEIMQAHDMDENGLLSFDEFLRAMPLNVTNIPKQDHREAEIRRMFLEYDQDGNGFVSISEAHDILQKELALTPQQSIHLVRKYDTNRDGHLDYEEFVKFYTTVKNKAEEIKLMFEHFDKDKSKSISMSEAKEMLRQLGIPGSDVQTLVTMYDRNGDGELQYNEFVQFLAHM